MSRYRALIAGATGTVGRILADYLAKQSDWTVIGLARRIPSRPTNYPIISIDISDPVACRQKLQGFNGITHILYCARAPHATWPDEPIELNAAMLRNVLDAVETAVPELRHVHIVQGSVVYGSDLGPYETPAKESHPRVASPNWYYAQEDLVAVRSRDRNWTWSASRPHGVCDPTPAPRSLAMIIAVYAAIMKELERPLSFPGTARGFKALYQSVEATLLAKAIAWISTTPLCANQAFNVTNGDFIRWGNLWPRLADFFGMKTGPVKSVRLEQAMANKASIWGAIVQKYGLKPTPYKDVAVWSYGDFNFRRNYDVMSSTLKLRQSGFSECMDTEEMFFNTWNPFGNNARYRRHRPYKV